MKSPNIVIFGFVMAALQLSCEDVIDIQTAEAPKQVVVDAWINNQLSTQTIRITSSQPYFNPDFAEAVTGALVEVSSSTGEKYVFEETSPGTYQWSPANGEIIGTPGDNFELTASLSDQTLTANSTMFPVPEIDSIAQEFRENELGGPDGIYTQFLARDLPGLGNTYWIKTYKNDQYLNKPEEINLAFDAGFDGGSQIDGIIFIPPIRELINPVPDSTESANDIPPYVAGDKVRVEIHSITFEAFRFMESVRDQILNGSNTIFASPISNSKGNINSDKTNTEVLGVFCVSAVESEEKVIE
ncbi:MAG: DUF4249 domain-containing protein [Saprospiraceae bacterium]|nr:DUF4249 domain-containing protein [Saprospiraceae bacterium]